MPRPGFKANSNPSAVFVTGTTKPLWLGKQDGDPDVVYKGSMARTDVRRKPPGICFFTIDRKCKTETFHLRSSVLLVSFKQLESFLGAPVDWLTLSSSRSIVAEHITTLALSTMSSSDISFLPTKFRIIPQCQSIALGIPVLVLRRLTISDLQFIDKIKEEVKAVETALKAMPRLYKTSRVYGLAVFGVRAYLYTHDTKTMEIIKDSELQELTSDEGLKSLKEIAEFYDQERSDKDKSLRRLRPPPSAMETTIHTLVMAGNCFTVFPRQLHRLSSSSRSEPWRRRPAGSSRSGLTVAAFFTILLSVKLGRASNQVFHSMMLAIIGCRSASFSTMEHNSESPNHYLLLVVNFVLFAVLHGDWEEFYDVVMWSIRLWVFCGTKTEDFTMVEVDSRGELVLKSLKPKDISHMA
ncbi:hypothetical protein C8J56DRAFT_1028371 [Mycena floridula]|nr:hypothetical protein C8J56DRAFT_1028371 [Mycena floridula]